MTVERRMDTVERRRFWNDVDRLAAQAKNLPNWMRGNEEHDDRLLEHLDKTAEAFHPQYGPCDGLLDGRCSECNKVLARVEVLEAALGLRHSVLTRKLSEPGDDTAELMEEATAIEAALHPEEAGE